MRQPRRAVRSVARWALTSGVGRWRSLEAPREPREHHRALPAVGTDGRNAEVMVVDVDALELERRGITRTARLLPLGRRGFAPPHPVTRGARHGLPRHGGVVSDFALDVDA